MLVADWMNALNVFTVATLYMEMTLCFVLNAISITFMIYFRMFSPINMLVINLAIADILYSSCVPYYVRQFDDMMIPQTKFGCRMSFILDVTCMIVRPVNFFFKLIIFFYPRLNHSLILKISDIYSLV